MSRIAITGGVAEGKSTVLAYISSLGYSVESSDRIARDVFERVDVQAKLSDLLKAPSPVSRESLRAALADPKIRRSVNSITHPLIRREMAASKADFFEVPLLIEACLQGQFKQTWVVTCGQEEQLRRLTARLGSEEAAQRLIRTQLTSRAKLPFADCVIRTNQDESSVQRCVTLAAQQELG